MKTREARHVLPIATFTTLAAQLRKKDKERRGRKKKRDTTNQDGLVELALSQAAEFGIRPEELQGRLDEVLDVQKVLEVVEEGLIPTSCKAGCKRCFTFKGCSL